MAARDKPPSCLRQGRGVAPRASRLLACGKGGGFVPALGRDAPDVYGRPILLARLAAGGSCPFLGLAAGEASPAPPGRGLCPLPSPLKGALPPRPPNGGEVSPLPPSYGPGGPGGTSRLLACGKGGCVTARDKPPSCVPQGREFRFCTWVETRERASMTHTARASASGPKREAKFFAPLSFKKAGEAGEIGRGIGSVL